jgi:excisionase family DNA binding protein
LLTNTTSNDSQWLRLPDAAKIAQCSVLTLRREIRSGRLRAVRVGGRKLIRVHRHAIDEWLSSTPAVEVAK